jgi:hypothetical protein
MNRTYCFGPEIEPGAARVNNKAPKQGGSSGSELSAHFGGVLVGVEASEKMASVVR